MPIDLVIDEREGGSTPGSVAGSKDGLSGDNNNKCGAAAAAAADSSSHTDGASTPDLVSLVLVKLLFGISNRERPEIAASRTRQ